jgi:DNA repair protein SbcC/Rad50
LRPLRLELEGFTSFKERLVLDFEGLDLFAITGPTGAGKSSLIDALVFALYGQVPRVGREYKQLVSHGAERLSVGLDFEVGGKRYRVARTVRVSGNPQVVLEQRADSGFEPLAGRVKEIEAAIEKIVGLDYDAFTRSVVLPQGQFDAFLKGEPKERRKILVALLNLGVYEDMQQIANRRATDARREAGFIANQLASDFQDVVPDALEAARKALAEARSRHDHAEKTLAKVTEALAVAQGVVTARRELEGIERDLAGERDRATRAAATLAEAATRREALAAEQAAVGSRLEAVRFDASRHQAVLAAKPRAEQLAELVPRGERLEKSLAKQATAGLAARVRLAEAEGAVPALEQRLEEALARVEQARAEREALHRRHAAVDLRRHLEPGELCPVCEQTVRTLPPASAPALGEADDVVRKAEALGAEARTSLDQGRLARERLWGEVARFEAQSAQIESQREDLRREGGAVAEALETLGVKPLERADPKALLARLSRELLDLEKERQERERLEAEVRRLETAARQLEAAVAAAAGLREAAASRVKDLESRSRSARDVLAAAAKALAGLLKLDRLSSAPVNDRGGDGRDEAALLEAHREEIRKESTEAAAEIARLEATASRLERDLARSLELQDRKKTLEAQTALANTLAQHLRADQLLAFIQEEALRQLAEDGSRRLEALSLGRYSLVVDDQEFAVVDHWNADSHRSVKTLSGGETFLASLALALALAEGLAGLASEGRAGDPLESLFLDEGFGTLDPETLAQVVQALDALHGGRRMVGVVTHIPELAAQLPARVEVSRGEGTARVLVS